MSNETYNGWTNRETWAVNVWASNDEPIYNYINDALLNVIESDGLSASVKLEEAFRAEFEGWLEMLKETNAGASDVFNVLEDIGSLWRVNWYELAKSWAEDLVKSEPDLANN